MVFSNKLPQSLFLLLLIVFSFSCSKEDEEVGRPDYTTTTFDNGHLKIKLLADPANVDSVIYTNTTKGVINTVTSSFAFDQPNNLSVLSEPLVNGNTGDQVSCRVYLNSAVDIGVIFEDIHLDSINTVFTSASTYYIQGTY